MIVSKVNIPLCPNDNLCYFLGGVSTTSGVGSVLTITLAPVGAERFLAPAVVIVTVLVFAPDGVNPGLVSVTVEVIDVPVPVKAPNVATTSVLNTGADAIPTSE